MQIKVPPPNNSKTIITRIALAFSNFFKKIIFYPIGVVRYIKTIIEYSIKKSSDDFPIKGINPVLLDKYMSAGSIDGHYFLQDIYVASKILEHNPVNHYDIGSRVDGFIAHLLTGFKEEQSVTMLDIRPLPVNIPKLNFIQTDATLLAEIEDESIYSLSSLHAIEHFGLGRYGDKIEPGACFTAMKAIQRVIAKRGFLYFSVPIGTENATFFNAHRIFTPKTILDIFDCMELLEFSYIHNYKITTINGTDAITQISNSSLGIHDYDCGIFIFRKK